MGMFDTVYMTCPHCQKRTSEQTKAGGCILAGYELNEDSVTTVDMVGKHWCEHCNKPFKVELINRPFAREFVCGEEE